MKTERDMKAVAAMLACPHAWGDERDVTLVEGKKRRQARHATCSLCGTHRMKYPDGTASLLPPDGISEKPPV